ncbi:DEAD/DEAH box helicase family protein [Vibrio breoganii]
MKFSDLVLPINITTGYQDPNKDFFSPILGASKEFCVAVGYFTSGWLQDVVDGLHEMALKGGRCKFIISPNMDPNDEDIIRHTYRLEDENCLQLLEDKLVSDIACLGKDKREILSNLILSGVLTFRIALPKRDGTNLFHAKIGVAKDDESKYIAFNGSFNFTSNAKSNWEYIDIYQEDSNREKQRIKEIQNRFDVLWNNEDIFYDVVAPSDSFKTSVKSFGSKTVENYKIEHTLEPVNLRDYQNEAVSRWWKNKGQGMLVMATGSGKTITALSAVNKVVSSLQEKKQPIFVLFVLPLKHLLDQWHDEALEKFGFKSVKCYEESSVWRNELSDLLTKQTFDSNGVVMAMVTNSTLSSSNFQKTIRNISTPFMIVADEAHNLGSETYLESLPAKATIRLGLTATPERYNDPDGTNKLIEYFNDVVYEFSLEDAINAGFLVDYNYFPYKCEFNDEEFQEYKTLVSSLEDKSTSRITFESDLDNLTGAASNKILILHSKLQELKVSENLKHTLVYCGSQKDDEGSRQIEKVVRILGKELKVKTRKFTAEESTFDRQKILKQFTAGDLEAIVAIKCLDEGVDVPATKQAFILASTANPREFIQRRGRVLRLSQGKSTANIYDFIMVPPPGETNSRLVSREVRRGLEYNSLALNKDKNNELFDDLIEEHDVELD